MKIWILLVLLLVSIFLGNGILIRLISASHYVYLAEDPARQFESTPFTDNSVMVKWWWAEPVRWWVADPSISIDAQAAMNNWHNAIPQLNFEPASDFTSADLAFLYAPTFAACPAEPGQPPPLGCFVMNTPENRIWERATYIRTAVIWMNSTYDWTSAGPAVRQGLFMHELGHAYGLNERYIEGSPSYCNNNEITVMDLFPVNNNVPSTCDGLTGPSALDVQRVVDYWSKGEAFSFTGATVNRLIVGMWKDLSWTETLTL